MWKLWFFNNNDITLWSYSADGILVDCCQTSQSAEINSPPKFPAIRYWREPQAMVRDDLLQPKPQCSLSGHVEGKQTNVLYQKSGRKYEMSQRILNDAKNMEQCIEYRKYKWCKISELCNGYSNGCKDKRITTNHLLSFCSSPAVHVVLFSLWSQRTLPDQGVKRSSQGQRVWNLCGM